MLLLTFATNTSSAGARACARVDILDPVPDFCVTAASAWSWIGDWRLDCSDLGALTLHVRAAGWSHSGNC